MAVINIPMGGRAVPIEVPDFAMESTQQAILQTSQQMNAALAQMAGIEQNTNINNQRLISAVKDVQRETQQGNQQQGRFSRLMERASVAGGNGSGFFREGSGLNGIVSASTGKEFSERLFNAMGMANVGLQAGMAMGYMEQLAQVMTNTMRSGVNFADDFIEVQRQAAGIGLTLQQFGKMVGENAEAMIGLGESTQAGSRRFLQFGSALQTAMDPFGNFGLKADEMAMLLSDEIELRRATMGIEKLRTLNEQELAGSLTEQIRLSTIQARLTGQDVREMRRRSMEARSDPVNASYLRTLATEEQRQAFGMIMENFNSSTAGALGDVFAEVVQRGVVLSGQVIDERGVLQEAGLRDDAQVLIDMLRSGVGAEQIRPVINQILDGFTDEMGPPELALRYRVESGQNDENARMLLEALAKRLSITPDASQQAERDVDENTQATRNLLGLNQQVAEIAASMQQAMSNFVIGLLGGDASSPEEIAEGFRKLGSTFVDGISSPEFLEKTRAAGTIFGETALQPFMRASLFMFGNDPNGQVRVTDFLGTYGAGLADILGKTEVASLLRGTTNMSALLSAMENGQLSTLIGTDPNSPTRQIANQIEQLVNSLGINNAQTISRSDMAQVERLLSDLINKISTS